MFKASIIGNLGSDPELKYAATGTALLRFNVAANYRAKNDQNEWADKTEWVRVTVFGTRAESLSGMLTKGTRVYVDGRLEARPWTDNSGNLRAGLELTADTVEFASNRPADDQGKLSPAGARGRSGGDDSDLPF